MGPALGRGAAAAACGGGRAHPRPLRGGLRAADRGAVLTTVGFTASADLDHPRDVVFGYLADPRNRPEWQAPLLSVTLHDRTAEPHVGMTWRDNTLALMRPRMEITRLEPPRVWAETGRWRGIRAELTMFFDTTPTGCRVRAEGSLSGGGVWAVPVAVACRLAGPAIVHDLRRVDDVLTRRPR